MLIQDNPVDKIKALIHLLWIGRGRRAKIGDASGPGPELYFIFREVDIN